MRENLRRWIADADTRYSMEDFGLKSRIDELEYVADRNVDLYFALVGELFDLIRAGSDDRPSWSALGNAMASVSRDLGGSTRLDALFFAAVAYYRGGYPASAVMTMRRTSPDQWTDEVHKACYDLLTRQASPASESVPALIAAVREGRMQVVEHAVAEAEQRTADALLTGPEQWVAHQLHATLLAQFRRVNLRAVLPDGSGRRWGPLITSFLNRRVPVWEFFPSQIEAIEAGLLTREDSFSLQMPTGAGKTALTETLLFSHLAESAGDRAVLLVPYRSLARELRHSVGMHLTRMGIQCRTIYGGTVPTAEENAELNDVRVIIATPEALTGLLSANPELVSSITLVVCDEGHLLDSESRGVGLELLLARLRSRAPAPRIVFVSAIVPNVEEINSWLGGTDSTVVRSDYRPALAEFAVLRPVGSGARLKVGLEFQELSTAVPSHTLPEFLQVSDFQFWNQKTGRRNTHKFDSKKAQAVAAGRKALPLGTVAVFASVKTGPQGVLSLAEELMAQIDSGIKLPSPAQYVEDATAIDDAAQYLTGEFGEGWIGTRTLKIGVVVHHGDVPQETREVLEELVSERLVRMVMCTSTLAEGVNLPIRTLVLYSIKRGSETGKSTAMLARDIKNLVGRAGRAGSTTRGLVICVNPDQWSDIQPVAAGQPGERVAGALIDLLRQLEVAVSRANDLPTNDDLETIPPLLSLVDGIDAALIELIHDELGSEEFMRIAASLAGGTFAAREASDSQHALLGQVFRLRAARLLEMRESGYLQWVSQTGARPRLVRSVVNRLRPSYDGWSTVESPLDDALLGTILDWAWEQPDFPEAVDRAYRNSGVEDTRTSLERLVSSWLEGHPFEDISRITGLNIDKLLRIHTKVVLHDLTTLVEQAIGLLQHCLLVEGEILALSVESLPDYLRYGVSSPSARFLMGSDVRHRRAAVALGDAIEMSGNTNILVTPKEIARSMLEDQEAWESQFGRLVYRRTVSDVSAEATK